MTSANSILVVDDDIQSLEVLSRVLQRDGYHTLTAPDGSTAVEAVRLHGIDLALVDFNLPDGTGDQVLYQIRQMRPSVPVLIMSADERNLLPAFNAGAYSFVPKPINLSILRNAISRALARKNEFAHDREPNIHIQRTSVWIRWSRRIIWWKSIE